MSHSDEYVSHTSIGNDLLVTGGSNTTLILPEQNCNWVESMVLGCSFNKYQVSGRSLFAANDNAVYLFDLQDCVQPMSTQMPTSSTAPITTPCYGIDIMVKYNRYPEKNILRAQRS